MMTFKSFPSTVSLSGLVTCTFNVNTQEEADEVAIIILRQMIKELPEQNFDKTREEYFKEKFGVGMLSLSNAMKNMPPQISDRFRCKETGLTIREVINLETNTYIEIQSISNKLIDLKKSAKSAIESIDIEMAYELINDIPDILNEKLSIEIKPSNQP